jgi:hypothetical protein
MFSCPQCPAKKQFKSEHALLSHTKAVHSAKRAAQEAKKYRMLKLVNKCEGQVYTTEDDPFLARVAEEHLKEEPVTMVNEEVLRMFTLQNVP